MIKMATEQSMMQTKTQAAIEAIKAAIITVRRKEGSTKPEEQHVQLQDQADYH